MLDAMGHLAPVPLPEPYARRQHQHEDISPGRTGANGDHAIRVPQGLSISVVLVDHWLYTHRGRARVKPTAMD
eukprot:12899438-Prorocentrum_lima.AAC.1